MRSLFTLACYITLFLIRRTNIFGQEISEIKCPPLFPNKNVEITCYSGSEKSDKLKTDCKRPQQIGTQAKYKCKSNHVPLEGTSLIPIDNELKCGKRGVWVGEHTFESFRCKEDCGRLTTNSKPLVVHGSATNSSLVPWHATIFRNSGSNWVYICGGSIIRNKVVISAAHCFALDHHHLHNTDEFRIILGSVSSSYVDNLREGVQIHKIQNIHISESYDPQKGYQADVAVIHLKDNIQFNENVVPVCLPNDYNTDLHAIKGGSVGQVAGFGVTEDGKISRTLRSLDLRVKSNSECNSALRRVLSESQFCGGERNGSNWETVCNGDSGGGIFVSSTVHQRYFIHGIVSSGNPDTDGGVCQNYAVFTRIYPFIFWIRDIIEEISGEIARDLHQNPPYPYALRGTETQMARFTGLPREWTNRITSLEMLYVKFSLRTMLNALEDAKPLDTINLQNIVLSFRNFSKHSVVLPVLSSFTLDTLPEDDEFENLKENRTFPIPITNPYLRKLLFFDKDFETKEKWTVSSLINLNTDVELIVHIFRLLRIRFLTGEIVMQQTSLANSLINAYGDNLDFTLQRLYLHRCSLDFQKLANIQTLTDLVLDVVVPTDSIMPSLPRLLNDLTELKTLVIYIPKNNNEIYSFDMSDTSTNLAHLSITNINVVNKHNGTTMENLQTLCCIQCKLQAKNFGKVFPNIKSIILENIQDFPLIDLEVPSLESIYVENSAKIWEQIQNKIGTKFLANSNRILLERAKDNSWSWKIPSLSERQTIFYSCTKQKYFWTSQEDYTALRRLKSFEKEAWKTKAYKFEGTSNPYTLEHFHEIPSAVQRNLQTIHLKSVDLTPETMADSVEFASNLRSLTLSNVTFDISNHEYKLIRKKSLELRLEKLDFREFTFHYVLEYYDAQLIAAVVPFQYVGRFNLGNFTNVLYHLFWNVNALRLTYNDSVVYVLDTTLAEARLFQEFVLKVIDALPQGHVLKDMSRALKERYELYQEGVLPPTWKFSGLHVVNQDLAKGFFRDDVLRVIGRTGILNFLLTRLGKFVTIERSTSLTLLKKDKNPLNFPLIHAISVKLNEEKIE